MNTGSLDNRNSPDASAASAPSGAGQPEGGAPLSGTRSLSVSERDLLEHIDWVGGLYHQSPELSTLFRRGYVQAHFIRWRNCFDAQITTTPQGAAIARRLN